jgi:hypothetical protein
MISTITPRLWLAATFLTLPFAPKHKISAFIWPMDDTSTMEHDEATTDEDESVQFEDEDLDQEDSHSDEESETQIVWVAPSLRQWTARIRNYDKIKDIHFARLQTTGGMWIPFHPYDWNHVFEDDEYDWQCCGPEEAIQRAQRHTYQLTGEFLLVEGDWGRLRRSGSHRGIVWAPDNALTQTRLLYYDTTDYEPITASFVDYIRILRTSRSERHAFDARMQGTQGLWIAF